jgi:beta-barrel assembly-enhancing protease
MTRALTLRVRRTAAIACLCGAGAAASCAPAMSTQQGVQIGADYARQINQQLPLVRDQQTLAYIDGLGQQIARVADPRGIRYHFYVVNSDVVNAFALPGGHIYLNRGLIERTENLSELVGVIAHEVAHVAERHSVEQLRRAQSAEMGLAVLYGVLLGRQPGGLERAGIQLGGGAVFAGYSRDAEREADREAIDYMIRTGYNPHGMVSFFEKLLAMQQRQPGTVEQWFATHPTTAERVQNTRAMIQQRNVNTAQLTTNTQAYVNFRNRLAALQPAPQDRQR